MNTPAHIIFGLAAFGKVDARRVTAAAIAGALIPDLSLYLLSGWHLYVLGTPSDVVFGQLYFSEGWQRIFRVDNSFVLWGIGLGIALLFRSSVAIALCGAALLHLATDFPFHHDDARAQFWPLTNWKFISPVSYWDPAHHGNIVAPIEAALTLALAALVWRRFKGWLFRTMVALLTVAEVLPPLLFHFVFSGQ